MNLNKYFICFVLITFFGIGQINSKSLNNRIDSLIKLMSTQDKIDQLSNNSNFTTPDNPTLGIPGFNMCDGPHGLGCKTSTSFPVGIAVAATWDISIAEKVGKAMGEEFWAFGLNQQLGPCIDLSEDPRAGRASEGGGEDPFLAGHIGAAVIRGIQTVPVVATVKHFMVEGKQNGRLNRNEIFTERWMMQHYGYNFRTAMQEGASFCIMNAYNLINGKYCSANSKLLDTILKQHWGFPFYVVSDWIAVRDAKGSILSGTDVCMGSDHYKDNLPGLISSGQVPMAVLNKTVSNVLRTKILVGMMDYHPKGNPTLANSAKHVKIALEASRESIVLLKNANNILPLNKSTVTKIAIIGPNANVGNLDGKGSAVVSPPYSISVKKGIETKIGASKVLYTIGCAMNSTDTSGF